MAQLLHGLLSSSEDVFLELSCVLLWYCNNTLILLEPISVEVLVQHGGV